jgi:alkylhydroperoxidase family enzyme
LARRLGAADAQVQAAVDGQLESAGFTEAELAALRFAEALTLHSTAIPDSIFEGLRRHFEESEIVELALVAGLFNYFNRFNNALDVEITR